MFRIGKHLYNKFPDLYLSEDSKNGFALQKFMEVLGGGFDKAEQDIINFSNIYNADLCPAPLLPLLAEQFGLEFPYDMDEATQRKFIKVLPFLYQYKGTDKAFKYLAREIFGEGTVTNSYTLSPPPGVSWDEWINDPKTQEDWQKLFVRLEVNGENLYLDDREVNFVKFAELIRPVNKKVIPNLVLFYEDIRDKAKTQEQYVWDWVKDDNGIYTYKLKELASDNYNTESIILAPEDEIYFTREKAIDFLDPLNLGVGKLTSIYYKLSEFDALDTIICAPDEEVRTKMMYDEHTKDIQTTLDEDASTREINEILDTILFKELSEDINEIPKDDSYFVEKQSHLDDDKFTRTKDDAYTLSVTIEAPLVETVRQGAEVNFNSTVTVTRTTTKIGLSKLVTNFRTTDFTPTGVKFDY